MKSIIEVKEVTRVFGSITALDRVSFRVGEGEIFAFLGPNGAGKTTVIKVLTTLLRPTSGTALVDGFDPMREPEAVRRRFGIVFQDQSLDEELSAYENLDFHALLYAVERSTRKSRIEEMLRFFELWDRRRERVKSFSGGMKRRLEVARALIHRPRILFLDEPTLGLDPQTRNHIWSYLKAENRKEGVTVFFTTHYMEEAERAAERIAVIDYGRIISEGRVDELMNRTKTESLEEAFLSLTGHSLRDEEGDSMESLRIGRRVWGR